MADWSIPDARRWTDHQRESFWEAVHVENDYSSIWSVTEEETFLAELIASINAVCPSPGTALIPGCGSRAVLERRLINEFPSLQLVATDYPGVVDKAAQRLQHDRVSYLPRNSSDLGWSEEFDLIVPVNSIVSESHAENVQMLHSMSTALRGGGSLVGLFPTSLATLDIAAVMRSSTQFDRVDLQRSTVRESDQLDQIFYTPLRLRRVLRDTGLRLERMNVVFFESARARAEANEHYQIEDDPDVLIYELLATARKVTNEGAGVG